MTEDNDNTIRRWDAIHVDETLKNNNTLFRNQYKFAYFIYFEDTQSI